jgi:hypothetical protein
VLGVVLNILQIRGSICSKVFLYHCIAAEKKKERKKEKKRKEKKRKNRRKEKR